MNSSSTSWKYLLAWHVAAAVAATVTPLRARLGPLWEANTGTLLVVAALVLTYAAIVAALTLRGRSDTRPKLATLLSTLTPIITLFLLFIVLVQPKYSRLVLLVSLVLVPTLATLATRIPPRIRKPALAALLIAAIVGWVPRVSHSSEPARALPAEAKIVASALYTLAATSYPLDLGAEEVTGGAISSFGDHYLLADGDGELYLLSWKTDTTGLNSRKLRNRIPLNRDQFIHDTSDKFVFRTADLLVEERRDEFRLFASHHHWNRSERCFTLRVSAAQGTFAAFLADQETLTWDTVYDSAPCLSSANRLQVGGKLDRLDSNHILLTVGDHGLDGVNAKAAISQDPNASYGKVVVIDLRTRAPSTYSMGHRNALGLHVDGAGTIWSTEQGPRGGDELNVIRRGANYGWPFATYGANYETNSWPLNRKQGRHDNFEPPVYAWVPSIAITSVIRLNGDLFKNWESDLLVSSLRGSLWRIRVENERVVFAEPINVGGRLRDVLEDRTGRILGWDDTVGRGAIVVVEPAPAKGELSTTTSPGLSDGAVLFTQCSGCHRQDDAQPHGIGPSLNGIIGRRIAAAPGYSYSKALRSVRGEWSPEMLDAFLANPQRFAPGSTMESGGVTDPDERARLIGYLKALR